MSDTGDVGFTYPKRWSEIVNLDPASVALLDTKQEEMEQFLYGAPERVDLGVVLLSGAATGLVQSFQASRHNRLRGRQVFLSWIIQFSASGVVNTFVGLTLPKSLWPTGPMPPSGTRVPAAGVATCYTVGHVAGAGRVSVEVVDYRPTLGTWVIDTGITELSINGRMPDAFLVGHVVYGIAP